jgi:WD40 repeat protein
MRKFVLLGAMLVLMVSCLGLPESSSYTGPAVIIATNAATLTADETMPPLQVITPENAFYVHLLRTLEIPDYVRGEVSQCNAAFSPDGSLVLGVCGKNPVAVWDVQSGQLRYTLYPAGVQVVSCTFSPDGSLIACGGFDRKVTLWNAEDGSLAKEFETIYGPVWEIAFSPDGKTLTSCGIRDSVRFWDTVSGEQTGIASSLHDCLSLAWHPDGQVLTFSSLDGSIELIEATSGADLGEICTPGDHIGDIAFNNSGTMLIAGRDDDLTYVWNVTDPTAAYGYSSLDPLYGHYHFVNGVAFSPDDALFISSSHDNTTHIVNAESLETLKILGGHYGVILRSTFNDQGTLIATIGWDGTVRLWGIGEY